MSTRGKGQPTRKRIGAESLAEKPGPETAEMVGCSFGISAFKGPLNESRLGSGPPNRTVSPEFPGENSRVIQSESKQRRFGMLKQTIMPLGLVDSEVTAVSYIIMIIFLIFFLPCVNSCKTNQRQTAEGRHFQKPLIFG